MSTQWRSSLAGIKLKQLLWPSIWIVLVIWILMDTLGQSPAHTSTFKNAINPLNNNTSSSLSDKLHGYYDSITRIGGEKTILANATTSIVTADVRTSNKVAVIVETRRSGQVIPLIIHFATVLGPDWPVIIYTSAENFGSFSTSQALLRYQKAGRIVIRSLPEGVFFPNWDSVSAFLTKKWMWEELAPAEHILIFQSDSILCSNSVRSVEEFFEYDLIGAPIIATFGAGYNGGLSLRKRTSILRILDEFDWTTATGMRAEDQWFYHRMKILAERDEAEGLENGVKLPSMEIARTFAVETIDYPNPLGLHQPTRFIHQHMRSLDEYCPEYKLARTDRIVE